MPELIKIEDIKWDPSIYPRQKWNTATVERYADAMLAGDKFPALIIEKDTNRLLDGKQRMLAYEKTGTEDVPVEIVTVPKGLSAKYFAATLSSRHGDRMSNTDLKALALIEFDPKEHKDDPNWKMPDAQEWGKGLSVSKSTVYEWVSHFINRARSDRQIKVWRLAQLGWTQQEIAERFNVVQKTISDDLSKNSEIGKITNSLGENWNAESVSEWANRMQVPLTDATAAAMKDYDDEQRLKFLGIKIQPYDVWNFQGCYDLMGDKHPGRIPGEIICHILWAWTKPSDLVIDPMAGSGTALDACLLMGRRARGYDIDLHHNRCDIELHDLSEGWPEKTSKADLVFWDPPYFDKKDGEYIDSSISRKTPVDYLAWFTARFTELHAISKPSIKLAFLMSDWDSENAKHHADTDGIFLWDYARALQVAGWKVTRQVQVPLPTQQIHPDIVNKFRISRRLARLNRYLLMCNL